MLHNRNILLVLCCDPSVPQVTRCSLPHNRGCSPTIHLCRYGVIKQVVRLCCDRQVAVALAYAEPGCTVIFVSSDSAPVAGLSHARESAVVDQV